MSSTVKSRWKFGILIFALCIRVCVVHPCLDWAMIASAAGGKTREITWLLKIGGDPNTRTVDPGYAIRQASAWNQREALHLLLNAGGNPDLRSESGETALLLAAGQGNAQIVRMLLAAKADPNLDDGDGTTPITYAREYPEIVTLLKQYGAKP